MFPCVWLLCTSCQFFETEKISSETFYEEEVKTITWHDVDQYPTFRVCERIVEKEGQQQCFIATLSAHLQNTIQARNIVSMNVLNDTVSIALSIEKNGTLLVRHIELDSLVRAEFPLLESWLRKSIDSLQPTAPAYKRGIPVKTEFTLPIVLTTPDL
ncbi:MAG: hypothetical protein CMC08_03245 [Flavobacteriaceae bacterium]|nr:hypothetical protein [Flavobacteriaceae bacterium]